MDKYDSSIETYEHIERVAFYLGRIIEALKSDADRAILEDELSLENVTLVDLLCVLRYGGEIPAYSDLFKAIMRNSIDYLKTYHKTDFMTSEQLLNYYIQELEERGKNHDKSKLESPEKEGYDVFKPALKSVPYGSPEYQKYLAQMQDVVKHHYLCNRHHPEHFDNGIYGMNIMDLIEMLCDWKAASERYGGCDFIESLGTTNKERFNLDDAMVSVLKNTAIKYFA